MVLWDATVFLVALLGKSRFFRALSTAPPPSDSSERYYPRESGLVPPSAEWNHFRKSSTAGFLIMPQGGYDRLAGPLDHTPPPPPPPMEPVVLWSRLLDSTCGELVWYGTRFCSAHWVNPQTRLPLVGFNVRNGEFDLRSFVFVNSSWELQ